MLSDRAILKRDNVTLEKHTGRRGKLTAVLGRVSELNVNVVMCSLLQAQSTRQYRLPSAQDCSTRQIDVADLIDRSTACAPPDDVNHDVSAFDMHLNSEELSVVVRVGPRFICTR